MLGLKTLLRLVIAAAVITGGLYGVMEFGRPHAGQGQQADNRAAETATIETARAPEPKAPESMAPEPAVPDFRPSMDAVAPAAPASQEATRSLTSDAQHQASAPAAPASEPTPQPTGQAAAVHQTEPAPAAPVAPAPSSVTQAQEPAAADVAVAEPPAEPQAQLPATGALSDPADEPAQAPVTEKPKKVKTAKGGLVCTTFRSYNAETGTYRGLDGKVHDCKPPPLH